MSGCPDALVPAVRGRPVTLCRSARTEPADDQDPTGFPQTHIRAARMSRGRALCVRAGAGVLRAAGPGDRAEPHTALTAFRQRQLLARHGRGAAGRQDLSRPGSRSGGTARGSRLSPRRRVPRRCRPGRRRPSEGLKATCVGRTRPARSGEVPVGCAAESCAQHGGDGVEFESGTQVGKGLGFNASARGGGIEPTRRRGTMQVVTGLGPWCPDVPVNDDPRPHEVLAAPGASLGQHESRPLRRRCVTNVDSGFPASGRVARPGCRPASQACWYPPAGIGAVRALRLRRVGRSRWLT